MAIFVCTYPDNPDPLSLAVQFKRHLLPVIVDLECVDEYSNSITKLETALKSSGRDQALFVPLTSMKRNANDFGPQFRFTIHARPECRLTGAINRRMLSVISDDSMPEDVLNRLIEFAKGIKDATIEVEDDAGNPLPIVCA